MRAICVEVLSINCSECRDDLLVDCDAWGLPLPTERVILAPPHWRNRRCPHLENGLDLSYLGPGPRPRNSEVGDEEASERWKETEEEIEEPTWWNNLDASKDIGYPCREEGRYGSYPSYDGFGDESNP